MVEKIKEKAPIRKELKEKVKAAPKELLRRGLSDGTQCLRGQLRETAQRGQRDDYGGDQIEDAAWKGGRWGECGVEKLLRKKKSAKDRLSGGELHTHDLPISPESPAEPPSKSPAGRFPEFSSEPSLPHESHPRERPRIKTRETVSVRESDAGPSESGGAMLSPGERMRQTQIKTRKSVVRTPCPDVLPAPQTGLEQPSQALVQGKQAIKTAERSSKKVIKTTQRTAKTAQHTATTAQATVKATQRAVQAVRAIRKPPTVTARGAAKAGTAALRATVRAARMLAAALAAGGSVVVSVILVLCLVGVLVASPFGIFFADSSSPDTVAPSAAVAQINGELSDYLSGLQTGGTYDRVEILGQPPAWSDVFAVFAAKTAGAADGVDVVTLDAARVDLLRAVFWDMAKITTEEETVDHPASGSTPAWSETVLKITITPRTPDDMRVFYSFTDAQSQALDALLANGGLLTTLVGDLTISSQDAKTLLAALPADLDPKRRAVVETACRLVGKVNYFWGGKSRVIGWDERRGRPLPAWLLHNHHLGPGHPR